MMFPNTYNRAKSVNQGIGLFRPQNLAVVRRIGGPSRRIHSSWHKLAVFDELLFRPFQPLIDKSGQVCALKRARQLGCKFICEWEFKS